MVKRSAYECPICKEKSLLAMRTVLISPTRRIRYYVCRTPGCPGGGESEERFTVRPRKDADVLQNSGQPVRAA